MTIAVSGIACVRTVPLVQTCICEIGASRPLTYERDILISEASLQDLPRDSVCSYSQVTLQWLPLNRSEVNRVAVAGAVDEGGRPGGGSLREAAQSPPPSLLQPPSQARWYPRIGCLGLRSEVCCLQIEA